MPHIAKLDIAILAVVVVSITAVAALRPTRTATAGTDRDPASATRPATTTADGYVSSDTCRSCHPSHHQTWHDSYHRTMTQVVTPHTMLAPWEGTLEFRGKQYHLERDGDEYWVDMVDPEWDRKRRASGKLLASRNRTRRVRERVVQSTGSHHQQVYWIADGVGRDLRVFPFTWMIEEERWIPYEHSFLRPVSPFELSDVWNEVCIACHATGGRPRRDPNTWVHDTEVGELGIACEACHGPGAEHVAANQNPIRRYAAHLDGDGDPTIVNPARLDARASAQVCGQCHSVFGHRGKKWKKSWSQGGFVYRPGDELEKARFVYQRPDEELLDDDGVAYADSVTWPDGMIRVSGRDYQGLIASPCYDEAGDFTCLSCHSMHDSDPVDQLRRDLDADATCLQCHDEIGVDVAAHTRHSPDSAGSRCYGCHMPYTTYGLFKTIRSHTISSPTVAESRDHGRPNACNLCHVDKSLQWTKEQLERLWPTPQADVTDDDHRAFPAALVWLLKGDAAQRAIAVDALGRDASHQAAGADWIAPFLGEVFDDPYRAVRFMAHRAVRTLPGLADFDFDFLEPGDAFERLRARLAEVGADASAPLDAGEIADLKSRRDDRLVRIAE